MPAATDVDGTVESYQLVDDVTEGSLTFNDGYKHVHSRQRLLMTSAAGQDRDVTFTYTATDNDHSERAEDHHHYRDYRAATTRQWQRRD
ncbi:Ig-like domain-containing protein [Vibrio lentus]|nr:Ig-like domain-containing protein [Vibrio lentus]